MKTQRNLIAAALLSTITLTACAGSYSSGDGYGSSSSYSSNNSYASNNSYGSKSSYAKNYDKKPASAGIVTTTNTSIGEVFSTAKGMTLYTFDKDAPATSNCYEACATKWPPFFAKADAKTWGEFSVIQRKDGFYQWAYKNQPLYTWIGDQQKGDVKGHGIGNVWYAAKTH